MTSQGTKIEIEIEIEIQYSVLEIEIEIEIQYSVRNPPQSDLHVSALVIVLVVIALFVIEPTVYAFFLTSDSPTSDSTIPLGTHAPRPPVQSPD